MNGNNLNGVINIYKEPGYTSHDVVAILRRVLKTKKIGHAGTLDPNVSGVLPICIGKATKISSFLMDYGKTYIAEITIGIETDTEDIWGHVTKTSDLKLDIDKLKETIKNIDGKTIEQIPPMYSAIKVNGKKLYELARKGKSIERKSRKIHIYNIELLECYNDKFQIKVQCSKGTYIRTLIKDICKNSGVIGVMSNLIRTSSGGLCISDSLKIEQIENLVNKNCFEFITPIEDSLNDFDEYVVEEKYFKKLVNGVKLEIQEDILSEKILVYCKNKFIGIGKTIIVNEEKFLKITNMFWSADESNKCK